VRWKYKETAVFNNPPNQVDLTVILLSMPTKIARNSFLSDEHSEAKTIKPYKKQD
jgi:hypothetical protein